MKTIKAAALTGYGFNSDYELQEAFLKAGAKADRIHVQDCIDNPAVIHDYHVLGFPGGFSFGDHLGSGLALVNLIQQKLKPELKRFISYGKLIIGICNGFQILVKMGILPDSSGTGEQEVSLVHNDSGVFNNSWVQVTFNSQSPCVWTRGLSDVDLPIRHGEGKLILGTKEIERIVVNNNLVALTYSDVNPNGSDLDIAGICDPTGRIFGLMPHPEAYIIRQNHPNWNSGTVKQQIGLDIFKNGVDYLQKHL